MNTFTSQKAVNLVKKFLLGTGYVIAESSGREVRNTEVQTIYLRFDNFVNGIPLVVFNSPVWTQKLRLVSVVKKNSHVLTVHGLRDDNSTFSFEIHKK